MPYAFSSVSEGEAIECLSCCDCISHVRKKCLKARGKLERESISEKIEINFE